MAQGVTIGLLGAGRIARLVHLGVLARLPGARITVIAEPDAARRADAGRLAPHARRSADWRAALDTPGLEAVVICLPNPLHAEAAEAAFARGLHVYLEKPIALSVREGERLVAAWRRSGRVGMTGFNYRFHPMHRTARAHLARGGPGALVAIRTRFTTPARALPPWQEARATGGGVLLNLGVHHFDLVPFLVGARVTSVAATVRSMQSEGDTAAVHMELEGGVPVQSLFSMSAAATDRITLIGERGTLVLDRMRAGNVRFESAAPSGGPLGDVARELAGVPDIATNAVRALRRRPEPSFAAAFAAFVAAARGAQVELPDLAAGLHALRVVEAAEASAAAGGGLRAVAEP